MYCINLESDNPFFNLAIEEIFLKNSDQEYLLLGINSPSVIIGKHQSAHREVNTKFVSENEIPVIRRISGGGTVFHDRGNLNFSFIRNSEVGKQIDFMKYTLPVIEFLSYCGVNAKFEGKNDIRTGGLKISGNAEHVHRNRVLHHGTLLFSASLDMLRNSLRKDPSCYTSRAVTSNPSSIVNLNDVTKKFRDISEFRSEMMSYLMRNMPGMESYKITRPEKKEAEKLAELKYKTWEWNFAYGPEYAFRNCFSINGEKHCCRLSVVDGIIRECEITGSAVLTTVSEKLVGCRHMVSDLRDVLSGEGIIISPEEIFNFF